MKNRKPVTLFSGSVFIANKTKAATMTPTRGLILSIDEAQGPLTRLDELEDDLGLEAIVRAMDAGVPLYDAGGVLFASWSAIALVDELRAKADAMAES